MALLFFIIWVMLNGKFTVEIALFGIGISVLIYLFIWKILGYNGGGLSFLDIEAVRSLPEHIDLTSSTAKAVFPFNQLQLADDFKGFQSLKGLKGNQCSKLKNTIKTLLKFV